MAANILYDQINAEIRYLVLSNHRIKSLVWQDKLYWQISDKEINIMSFKSLSIFKDSLSIKYKKYPFYKILGFSSAALIVIENQKSRDKWLNRKTHNSQFEKHT